MQRNSNIFTHHNLENFYVHLFFSLVDRDFSVVLPYPAAAYKIIILRLNINYDCLANGSGLL